MEKVLFNGAPVSLCGSVPRPGDKAPGFVLTGKDLAEIRLADMSGRRVVLNVFPSLDTEVCAASVRRFNSEAAGLTDTEVLCVSMDLPFAAARFCTANGIDHVRPASAFRSDFGRDYGLTIAEGPLRGLLARAVVVIGADGCVMDVSLSHEITEEPDYGFVRQLLG